MFLRLALSLHIWIGIAYGNHECFRCITLEDLITPALGIDFSLAELSSALAYHNGTLSLTATTSSSPEYQNLMHTFRSESQGSQLDQPWHVCQPPFFYDEDMSFLQSSYTWLTAVASRLLSLLASAHHNNTEPTSSPPSRETSIIHDNLKTLLALNPQSSEGSLRAIGFSLPEWTTDHQACHFFDAITLLGKRVRTIESAPAAAFSAYGYSLCRVSSDWLPCPAPGRIMTLHASEDAATATMIKTPSFWGTLGYDVRDSEGLVSRDADGATKALTEWVNEFAQRYKPDKAILLGRFLNDSIYKDAVGNSKIANFIVDSPAGIDPANVVALGVAKITKDMMESQGEDCFEFEECEDIRAKADEIAGSTGFTHREFDFARTRREGRTEL